MKKSKIDGSYDPRYYTLDRLNEISLSNVRLNLKQFMKDYDITEYPIDCFRLVKKIQDAKLIHLEVLEEGRMSAAFNAVATYLPEVDSFQIVMKPVPKDWQKRSSWRRCNFSLAHELGHVFCGHLDVPKNMKSPEKRQMEDLEADEFAARLLMPERLILKSQFSSYQELSKEFLVSDQACYKRLNNLKRLDLCRIPARDTCPQCGNSQISPVADYCEICGEYLPLGGKQGVRIVEYTRTLADRHNRVIFCPVCGNEEFGDDAKYCKICGTPVYNFCGNNNTFWPCNHINSPNARFCEMCGSETVYQLRGLLQDWKKEKEDYIRAVTQS